jgi:hypothetical protein
VSALQWPVQHLDLSGPPEPVLLMDLSALQSSEACAAPEQVYYTGGHKEMSSISADQ